MIIVGGLLLIVGLLCYAKAIQVKRSSSVLAWFWWIFGTAAWVPGVVLIGAQVQ